jgi:uncharacterized protein (DUF486 family)
MVGKTLPTLLLLICSNGFMTVAWYGHLRFPTSRLWLAILLSWMIALAEYCFAVPANRIGYANGLSGGQLKIIQECVTLSVFAIFAALVLGEPLGWRYLGAFICMIGAAAFMFAGRT